MVGARAPGCVMHPPEFTLVARRLRRGLGVWVHVRAGPGLTRQEPDQPGDDLCLLHNLPRSANLLIKLW
jgi:hypothetical protein